jgi:hypothetical protein
LKKWGVIGAVAMGAIIFSIGLPLAGKQIAKITHDDTPIFWSVNSRYFFQIIDNDVEYKFEIAIGKKVFRNQRFAQRDFFDYGPTKDIVVSLKDINLYERAFFNNRPVITVLGSSICDDYGINSDNMIDNDKYYPDVQHKINIGEEIIIWDQYVISLYDNSEEVRSVWDFSGNLTSLIGSEEYNVACFYVQDAEFLNQPKYYYYEAKDQLYIFYKDGNGVFVRVLTCL